MADRFAIVLAFIDSQHSWEYEAAPQFGPFNDDDFYTSASADEIRRMPIYQQAIEEIRGMVG